MPPAPEGSRRSLAGPPTEGPLALVTVRATEHAETVIETHPNDGPATRLQRTHADRRKVRLDDSAILGVLRRIQSIGHRSMGGDRAAECCMIRERAHDIAMTKQ